MTRKARLEGAACNQAYGAGAVAQPALIPAREWRQGLGTRVATLGANRHGSPGPLTLNENVTPAPPSSPPSLTQAVFRKKGEKP